MVFGSDGLAWRGMLLDGGGGRLSKPPPVRVPRHGGCCTLRWPRWEVHLQAELRLFQTIQEEGGSGRTGGVPGRMRARTGAGEGVGGAHTGENLEDRAFAAC